MQRGFVQRRVQREEQLTGPSSTGGLGCLCVTISADPARSERTFARPLRMIAPRQGPTRTEECTMDDKEWGPPARGYEKFPRNDGSIEGCDGHAQLTGPCGETMEFWLLVRNEEVVRASIVSDGCVTSHACGSMAAFLAETETGKWPPRSDRKPSSPPSAACRRSPSTAPCWPRTRCRIRLPRVFLFYDSHGDAAETHGDAPRGRNSGRRMRKPRRTRGSRKPRKARPAVAIFQTLRLP